MALTIGVDVGGTKVAAGVVDDRGTILEKVRRPTPTTNPKETAETIAEVVDLLKSKYEAVSAVGLGTAGFVDETRSTVLFAPNLAWRDEPIKEKVESLVGLPVVVENDGNATAWGEARFGAGRGENFLVLVALGTGIGGGIIINGELYRGRFGIGAEMGHFRVVPDGRRCGCGNRGCWEQYASGNALVHEARDLARVAPAMAGRLLELGDGRPEGISGPEVSQAAREGDKAALECFRTIAHWAGQGLADLSAILDPGAFIIGGGLSDAGDLLLDPIRAAFEDALTGRGHRPLPDIRIAELGSAAGIVGAADLARVRPFQDVIV
ncbi:ROK family glucokinase [Actinomadura mexicana]|uniref:Glucokinase n=1 Tax=Actinomadura mexicana TaxID=134959 RepID=A0A238Y9A5_9ACTN|nr:ROK family glucokinase [Actinomadura mexicana]SNR67398.1 glucokinase [Actinomadura mexicana]